MSNQIWTGRFDGEERLHHRIFQRVSLEKTVLTNDFVLHGFAVDEGVRRNKGRVGAKDAPDVIRKNMANFPVTNDRFRTSKGFSATGSIQLSRHEIIACFKEHGQLPLHYNLLQPQGPDAYDGTASLLDSRHKGCGRYSCRPLSLPLNDEMSI